MMSVMSLEMEQEGRDIPPASGRAVEVEEDEEGRKRVMKPGRPDTAYPSGKRKYKKKENSTHDIPSRR